MNDLRVYAASPTSYVGFVGSPVDSAPSVAVSRGATLANGVAVSFRVLSGGGRVTTPVSVSTGLGRSTAGEWILGDQVGEQRLGAFIDDSLRVTFVATANALPVSELPPIVFSGEGSDKSWHIYVLDALSTARRQITSGTSNDRDPQPSPDSKTIAFLRDGTLHLMNRDGSNVRPIPQPEQSKPLNRLSWSPDGRKLVFGDMSTYGLSMIGIDGSNYTRLTRPQPAPLLCTGCMEFTDGQPDWSPDGTQIVFWRWEDLEFSVVWMMNSDGSNAQRIGRREMVNGGIRTWASWAPIWSHDHRIAFVGPSGGFTGTVWAMDRDGSHPTELATVHPALCNPADWSANGRWLLLSCGLASGSEIRLLSLTTRVITVIGNAFSPAFVE